MAILVIVAAAAAAVSAAARVDRSTGARTAGRAAADTGFTITSVDCGYPFVSSNLRTNIAFSESAVLRNLSVYGRLDQDPTGNAAQIAVFYNDEHALALGVRSVSTKTSSGTTAKTYSVTPYPGSPPAGGVHDPAVGATVAQGGIDASGRPMPPELFVTDITSNPTATGGDWQLVGGDGVAPNDLFGSWKAFTALIDMTKTPNTMTLTADSDPAKNNWTLGSGSDTPNVAGGFSALTNEGYGAEARWNVSSLGMLPGRTYRIQVMDHDGDQNKTGGDSGEACANVHMPIFQPQQSTTAANATIGANGTVAITDTVTLTNGSSSAGGSVTFHVYSDSACTTEAGSAGAPVNGANGKSYTSPGISVSKAGDYFWKVEYSGDIADAPIPLSSVACGSAANNEKTTVSPLQPAQSTAASNATLGTDGTANIHDTVTLTGGTSNAGGTLTFHLYSDGACSTQVGSNTAAVSGANGASYTSADINVAGAGDYFWKVEYGGDTNNLPIKLADVPCGSAANGELSHVDRIQPTVATTLSAANVDAGGKASDQAALSNATGSAGGTMTYNVYSTSDCTGTPVFTSGPLSFTGGTVPSSGLLGPFTAGTYQWQAVYSGDAKNKPATSVCGTESFAAVGLTINKKADSSSVLVGNAIGFTITVTGSGPAKNVTLSDPLPDGPAGNPLSWTIAGVTGKLGSGDCSISSTVTIPAPAGYFNGSSQMLTCNAVDLGGAPNGSASETYTVHITSTTSPTGPGFKLFNQATAKSDNHLPVTDSDAIGGDTDNSLSVSALSVEKHADTALVAAGSPIGFSITVTGSGPAKSVTLDDPLPAGPTGSGVTWTLANVGFVTPPGTAKPTCSITSVTSSPPGYTNGSTQKLHCNAVDLGSGSDGATPQSYVVHVTSPTLATSGFKLFNLATACSGTNCRTDDDSTEAPPGDNTVTVVGSCVLGYPFTSSNPKTSVAFNESGVLRSFTGSSSNVQMFYNDEHAMTLGVNNNALTTSPFQALFAKPGTTTPVAGNILAGVSVGDTSVNDGAGRPEYPALFVTDITSNPGATPQNHPGMAWNDWQFGGTPNAPDSVFGTWKFAKYASGSITPGADPAKNDWFLGPNADLANIPKALKNEGYGAEVKWLATSLGLLPGHVYRLQFMVHDGDQNKTGGDVGQACFNAVIK